MPVKIKHKQLDIIETVAYTNWANHYNHDSWDILEMWDVGEIWNIQTDKPIYQSTCDKQSFLDAMVDKTNQNALCFVPLPDMGRHLPVKKPIKFAIEIIKAVAISCLSILKKGLC